MIRVADIPVRRVTGMEFVEGGTATGGQILRTVPGEWIADHWVGRIRRAAQCRSRTRRASGRLMQDFAGRVAVVTGGASGVGSAYARDSPRRVRTSCLPISIRVGSRRPRAEIDVLGSGRTSQCNAMSPRKRRFARSPTRLFDEFGAVHLLFNNAGVGLGEAQREDLGRYRSATGAGVSTSMCLAWFTALRPSSRGCWRAGRGRGH